MSRSRAWIIGAGLAGSTAAFEFGRNGIRATVFEQTGQTGGLIRTATLGGVVYEPNGSHIFHTDDKEVWKLVNDLIPYWPYQHRVRTIVRGRALTWPIQADEIADTYGPETARELAELARAQVNLAQDRSDDPSFESWCLTMMPASVYEDFVKPYTQKQWGREANELSAEFAPRRVQVRFDKDHRLFKDKYQGFPDAQNGGTYDLQIRRLLSQAEVHLRTPIHLQTLNELLRRASRRQRPAFIIITAPLDEFTQQTLGPLEWRGLTFSARHIPDTAFAQERMVINWPNADVPWIRTHEAKHATRQDVRGTVVVTEFTGGPSKMYPVPRRDGRLRALNAEYMDLVDRELRAFSVRVAFAGRLATYRYQDQDDVIRDALDAVRHLLGA